jgi:site-specific DNA-methyltransferase (adenine-specific)
MSTPALFRYQGKRDQDWATPQEFFDVLDAEFCFTLDPCCTPQTAKCREYYTFADDGLSQPWAPHIAFCNPPYGRELPRWLEKAHQESLLGATCVCLVPAYTDTAWWHDIAAQGEIRLVRNRLYFERDGERRRSPFASAVIIFRPDGSGAGTVRNVEYSIEQRGRPVV